MNKLDIFEYYIYIQELFDITYNNFFKTSFDGYVYALVSNDEIKYVGCTCVEDYNERYKEHVYCAYEQQTTKLSKLYSYYRNNINEQFSMNIIIKHKVLCLLQLTLLEDSYIIYNNCINKLNSKINNKEIYNIIISDASDKKQKLNDIIYSKITQLNGNNIYNPKIENYTFDKIYYEEPISDDPKDWIITDSSFHLPKNLYNISLIKPLVISNNKSYIHENIYGLYFVKTDNYVSYIFSKGGFMNKNSSFVSKINSSKNVIIIPIEYYYANYEVLRYSDFEKRKNFIIPCINANLESFINNPSIIYNLIYPLTVIHSFYTDATLIINSENKKIRRKQIKTEKDNIINAVLNELSNNTTHIQVLKVKKNIRKIIKIKT